MTFMRRFLGANLCASEGPIPCAGGLLRFPTLSRCCAPRSNEACGVEAVHACLGEPEAHVKCGPSGELLLLGLELHSWRAVRLSRASELEDVLLEGETTPELERLAADARAALEAWTRSLQLLLPPGR